MPDRCPRCGRPLDLHDRHVRFTLPDPVLEVPEDGRKEKTWGNDTFLQVQGIGAFIRVLLPIRLTEDHTLTFGTWLGVHPDDLRRAWDVWEEAEYSSLRLNGRLANAIPPWGAATIAQPALARVIDDDAAPYITESEGEVLGAIIDREWPHEEILDAIDEATLRRVSSDE